jgi:arylsulfatase
MNLKSSRYFIVLLTIALAVIALIFFRNPKASEKPRRQSIILITIDTLRADHLSCYGYSRNTSPNIALLAQDSLLFTKCFSHSPETRLSFPSIFSGFFPHETLPNKDGYIEYVPFPAEVDTLAEILQREGYKTVGITSNTVLRKQPNPFKQGLRAAMNYYIFGKRTGWEQGFMIYDDSLTRNKDKSKGVGPAAKNVSNIAIDMLEKFHKEQLFIWIHYRDPHGAYKPPADYGTLFKYDNYEPHLLSVNESESGRNGIPAYQKLGEHRNAHYYISQYDGEIAYVDNQFKRLMDKIKEFGLYDDALIIFTSDHGEGMGEHDYYFAHGENLYNSLTHVPLIIRNGDHLRGVRDEFVQQIDIVPTILNTVGIETKLPLRGFDLRDENVIRDGIFAEMSLPKKWGGNMSMV